MCGGVYVLLLSGLIVQFVVLREAGSCMQHAACMPVHACRFMPAAADACVRTACVL